MFVRLIFSIAFFLSFNPLLAQKTSHNAFIKRVTKRIAYVGVLNCSKVGLGGYITPQYIRFDSLRKQCSSAELQVLVEHRAPVVRSYAFQALAERPEADLFPLLLKHQNDTAEFAQHCGCISSKSKVIDAMLSDYCLSSQYSRDKLISTKQEVVKQLKIKSLNRFRRERLQWRHATNRQRLRLRRQYDRATPQHEDSY